MDIDSISSVGKVKGERTEKKKKEIIEQESKRIDDKSELRSKSPFRAMNIHHPLLIILPLQNSKKNSKPKTSLI